MLRSITIWMFLAPLFACSASTITFRTVNVKDGLADNFIRDIVRDSYGYIWFSTINGISSYDGYLFCNYKPNPLGKRANDISFVRETADSTLWMICTGELYTFARSTWTWQKDGTSQLAKLGVKGTMKVLHVDDRHNLWVATDYGLYHYDYSQHKL